MRRSNWSVHTVKVRRKTRDSARDEGRNWYKVEPVKPVLFWTATNPKSYVSGFGSFGCLENLVSPAKKRQGSAANAANGAALESRGNFLEWDCELIPKECGGTTTWDVTSAVTIGRVGHELMAPRLEWHCQPGTLSSVSTDEQRR
ncbi:hypothetical protein CTAM01_08563 [Colletotrichum tamarilloi]|uniref:Uncharacterized protein n=1 Tax=Colletotrichum tamarilloi TaxID=1209934 RepID=A0ABQ9R5T8_9PEZI|nr:uncharacterized protein CTAM01_08563 [Colletotrichum tamarilloi]KAK1495434.1 hypothetical protein CTAM01_08563 [Colletotrichum tamarilloi]